MATDRLANDESINEYIVRDDNDVSLYASTKGWRLYSFSRTFDVDFSWNSPMSESGQLTRHVVSKLKPTSGDWHCMTSIAHHLLESELPDG